MSRLLFLAALSIVFVVPDAALLAAEPLREELVVASKNGPHVFRVEVADDARERQIGLMYRRTMAADEGMLFDFQSDQPVSFWMANTYISLDMLFIESDGTVESIAERATPLSEKSIPSEGAVRYVLEINGGLSDTLGIEPGDKVTGTALGLQD